MTAYAARATMTDVLPDPAEATTWTRLSKETTARTCSSVSGLRSMASKKGRSTFRLAATMRSFNSADTSGQVLGSRRQSRLFGRGQQRPVGSGRRAQCSGEHRAGRFEVGDGLGGDPAPGGDGIGEFFLGCGAPDGGFRGTRQRTARAGGKR